MNCSEYQILIPEVIALDKDKHVLPDMKHTFAAWVKRTARDRARNTTTIYGPDNEPLTSVRNNMGENG